MKRSMDLHAKCSHSARRNNQDMFCQQSLTHDKSYLVEDCNGKRKSLRQLLHTFHLAFLSVFSLYSSWLLKSVMDICRCGRQTKSYSLCLYKGRSRHSMCQDSCQ